jgi:hypothetical protein
MSVSVPERYEYEYPIEVSHKNWTTKPPPDLFLGRIDTVQLVFGELFIALALALTLH